MPATSRRSPSGKCANARGNSNKKAGDRSDAAPGKIHFESRASEDRSARFRLYHYLIGGTTGAGGTELATWVSVTVVVPGGATF